MTSVKVFSFACDSCPVKCRIEVVSGPLFRGAVMTDPCPFGRAVHLWRMVGEELLDHRPKSDSTNEAIITPDGPALFACRNCPLPCFLETKATSMFKRRFDPPYFSGGLVCPVSNDRTAKWWREDPAKTVPATAALTATEVAEFRRRYSACAVSDYEAWGMGKSRVEPVPSIVAAAALYQNHIRKLMDRINPSEVRKERDSS